MLEMPKKRKICHKVPHRETYHRVVENEIQLPPYSILLTQLNHNLGTPFFSSKVICLYSRITFLFTPFMR
jgi:hypothetical protein